MLAVFTSKEFDRLTFIMFFLHDIARTPEIHKTTQLHSKEASGTPKSTHRTRPFSKFNNNNNDNKHQRKGPVRTEEAREPKESTRRTRTLQNATKNVGSCWTPLCLYCLFYAILPELLNYIPKQVNCIPKKLLVHPNPLTGRDPLSNSTTTTTNTVGKAQ